ncbi:unnamed protein product [Lampetra fluviatilis]
MASTRLLSLCLLCLSAADCQVQRYDGWYNNLANIHWGSTGSKLLRLAPASFADGVYQMWDNPTVPNARRLSSGVMRGESGLPSALNRTVLAVFFGQHIVDEIVDTRQVGCPAEFLNIPIPWNDTAFSNSPYHVLPFQRSQWDKSTGSAPNNPRMPVNKVTSWLDGSAIYGCSRSWCHALRTFDRGMLKSSENGSLPAVSDRSLRLIGAPSPSYKAGSSGHSNLYEFGNSRGNESPFLKAIGTVWLRYHNHLAEKMRQENPEMSDKELFINARKWVVGVYQNIVLYEWLPAMLGKNTAEYKGYKPQVNPSISVEFQAAAMRFGHTMVPPGVYKRDDSCNFKPSDPKSEYNASRMCNNYWTKEVFRSGHEVDEFVLGMASQIAEQEDHVIVEDLLDSMYGPMKASRLDLMAINIQRGRDHGLPSYVKMRKAMNLDPITKWEDINPTLSQRNPEVIERLKQLYNGDISRLELWPGGLLECQGGPGPLFSRILVDQFERIRDGDRFWFENTNNGMFTKSDVDAVRRTKFSSVLQAVMRVNNRTIQDEVFFWRAGNPCQQPKQLAVSDLEPCTPPETIDYFSGSTGSFAATIVALLLLPVVCILVLCLVSRQRKKSFEKMKDQQQLKTGKKPGADGIRASEWQGKKEPLRDVRLRFDDAGSIKVLDCAGALLRSLEVKALSGVELLSASDRGNLLLVHVPQEYDLVLFFDSDLQRTRFQEDLDTFLRQFERHFISKSGGNEKLLLMNAVTKEQRQLILETYFRKIFATVLQIESFGPQDELNVSAQPVNESPVKCELSPSELGDLLGLKPDSTFLQHMFRLADGDKNGYLCFSELLSVLLVFIKGTAEAKSKLMFRMYEVSQTGCMTKKEFETMLRSFLELSDYSLPKEEEDSIMDSVCSEYGLNGKTEFTWQDLHKLLNEHYHDASNLQIHVAVLELRGGWSGGAFKRGQKGKLEKKIVENPEGRTGAEKSTWMSVDFGKVYKLVAPRGRLFTEARRQHYNRSKLGQSMQAVKRYVENYRRHIFCVVIFYGIMAGVMVERAYYYAVGAEHFGIRQVTEVGIILSRGTAAGISFCYSFILLTMCRNIITALRETALNHYIPFDSAVEFHKIIAMTAVILSILHSIGHVVNVYHFSVLPLSVLSCLFPNVFFNDGSEMPKKFYWWFFQTIPGMTGVLILAVLAVLYIFASRFARSHTFNAFWITHQLYILLYVLTILHGSVGLIQKPMFYVYFLPPALIFLGDRLLSLSRRKVEITVLKAELLPSGVTHLQFKRPQGFEYKSGQWVRVACLTLGRSEYHPFTLTSAPHEGTLSIHVRAAGPWTTRLREVYSSKSISSDGCFSKIYLDGPFGEGHQHWNDFEVSVLVGGGIGVTPFASILKDVVYKSSINARLIACRKLYFIWVTRTQRQFEWLTDIIQEVEENDKNDLVSIHIYITQFAEKFDLRTTMLYICERHFQKVSNRSLFTGLRSITHFGRPQFVPFLNSLQKLHPEVGTVGIFSCGPPGLTKTVEKSCRQLNRCDQTRFVHHYENF